MRTTRLMQPLCEMERVEQPLLGDKLDELFERIDKEDIGFVITENGKDKYVLCPFSWFASEYDEDVDSVVISAIRHELSAGSENADGIRRFIRNHYQTFDDRTILMAVNDLKEYCNEHPEETEEPGGWKDLLLILKTEVIIRSSQSEEGKLHE